MVWVAFVLRGCFYCVEQPIWEGYDEWAHFAYIQHVAEKRRLPSRTDPVSDEVRVSLELVPLPRTLGEWPAPHVTHDQFWRLPEHERLRREGELLRGSSKTKTHADSPRFVQYEAQQPPLYYSTLALVHAAAGDWLLPARVLLLRLVSLLIASMVIPLAHAAAHEVFRGDRAPLIIAILIAALPGLMIDVCRVGNESLAIVLISAVVLLALRSVRQGPTLGGWAFTGVVLGAALLTKAYALAFVPLIPGLAIIRWLREGAMRKQTLAGCMLPLALAQLRHGAADFDFFRRRRV